VSPDCSVPGHPETFVIGDAAYLVDAASGRPVPGVSQGALQMGRYVARVIDAELRGARSERAAGFHYHDKGSMATVGKSPRGGGDRPGCISAAGWRGFAWMALHITVAHRLSQPAGGAVILDLQLRVLPARLAVDHAGRTGDIRQPLAPSTPATPQRRS